LAVVDIVQSTLGPRGMDKLIYDDNGKTTISNDGATIMNMYAAESLHIESQQS
jgi:T-complex protein 1 subunit eta